VGKRLTDEERAWRSETERDFQTRTISLARQVGWRVSHFDHSRKMVRRGHSYIMVGDPDAQGFPDLVLARGAVLIFWELKRQLGQLRPGQQEWIDALAQTGLEAKVVRPSDWDTHMVPTLTAKPR